MLKPDFSIKRVAILFCAFALGACAVVPYPAGYRSAPVYVDSYPVYRSNNQGYEHGHHDRYGERHYRNDRRYNRDDERRIASPLEAAAQAHRDVRRSLGLPRLPGMP